MLDTSEGTLFAHERLYSDLGERPEPILEQLAALSNSEPFEPLRPNGNGQSEPDDYGWWLRSRRRAARDLPEMAAQVDPPERGLFRRFGYRRVLYLDIETCGLTASPVFLVGLCLIGEGNLVLRQLFARDYAEERALLSELHRLASEHDFLVTYNGKSFDLPFLRDRASLHRLPAPPPMPHLDLLWMARRRWKTVLPDCRLKTVEWHVLRRRRAVDIGSSEIPGLYHDYVRRGEAHRLIPVFHHNMLDVVAMVELTPVIFDPDAQAY